MADHARAPHPLRRARAVAESRLHRLVDGRYEYTPKKGIAFTLAAAQLVLRRAPRSVRTIDLLIIDRRRRNRR